MTPKNDHQKWPPKDQDHAKINIIRYMKWVKTEFFSSKLVWFSKQISNANISAPVRDNPKFWNSVMAGMTIWCLRFPPQSRGMQCFLRYMLNLPPLIGPRCFDCDLGCQGVQWPNRGYAPWIHSIYRIIPQAHLLFGADYILPGHWQNIKVLFPINTLTCTWQKPICYKYKFNTWPFEYCRYVQPACATTGDGLYEGLTWLTSNHKSWGVGPATCRKPSDYSCVSWFCV